MHRGKLLLLGAMLVAVFSLVAAGCGGDDDEEAAPPPAETGAGGGDTGAAPQPPAVTEEPAAEQILNMVVGAEPPSLDPGLASDTTSSNVILNIMDPLVKLGDDLAPVPSLAESWETSADGLTVTFTLRQDGKWTNGDPVTASDFVYSWKRTISPELAADYAYQFYGIVGAAEYNGCDPEKDDCAALADAVGVAAPDDYTLVVTLTSPQPWFVQQATHHSFLAVNQAAVEAAGDKWTEPENIVTNGPFQLTEWAHDSSLELTKWDEWRDAANVSLTEVNMRIISDGVTAQQAFEAGEVDSQDGSLVVPSEIPRLKETPEYQQYPALGTYYYGFNVNNLTDVNQRRAMSLVIDRQEIIDEIAQAGQLPATGFVPQGIPGFDVINAGGSPWLPPTADVEQAQSLMDQATEKKESLTLFFNDSPGHKEIGTAAQAYWSQLGIDVELKQQEWAQYLEFLGPPPNESVDVFRNGWIGDYVDAINFLELFTCKSGNNNTNWCNEEFDGLVDQARQTPDDAARYDLYAQAEGLLTGADSELPIMPIYWYTYTNLERACIRDTFNINLLDQFDLAKVVVEGECE